MDDGRIPKDIVFGELQIGKRSRGRPLLRYKDVCKRDMTDTDINIATWEEVAADRGVWRAKIRNGIGVKEKMIADRSHTKRVRSHLVHDGGNDPAFTCMHCGRHCVARIGLISHIRYRHGL